MKSIFLYILLIVGITAQGQQLNEYYFGKSVGIDKGRNGFAHPGASLDIGDTASKKGTILSRVVHRDSVADPVWGMIVYDKSDNRYYYRNRTTWVLFGSGGGGGTTTLTSSTNTINIAHAADNYDINVSIASPSNAGLMSAADKIKLDAIPSGGGTTAWGSISGNIADQTDLQTALNSKQAASAALSNIAALSVNGAVYRTGTNTYATRTLVSSNSDLVIVNGDGAGGNPTFSVSASVVKENTPATLRFKTIDGSENTLSNIGNLANSPTATTVPLTFSTGGGTTLPAATGTTAGVMTAGDKAMLDSLKNNQISDSTYFAIVVGTGDYDTVKMYVKPYGTTAYTGYNQFLIPKYQVTDLVQAGTNMTRTGSGKPGDPYIFNSTASGGGSGITALTGDVTASGTGSVPATIAANAITSVKINDGAVTDGKLATGINANKLGAGSVDNTELGYLDGVTSSIQAQLGAKQNNLVSGTSIKTINGESVLGSGNIAIAGGSGSSVTGSFTPTVGLTLGASVGTITPGNFTYTKTDSVSTVFGTVNFQVTGAGYAGVELSLPSAVRGAYNFENENQLSGTGSGRSVENITPAIIEPVIGNNIFMLYINAPAAGTYKVKLQMGVRVTTEPPVAVVDTAKFNFSLTARAIAGWTNVFGSPHLAVLSGTSSGVTISTTNTANWTPEASASAAQNSAPAFTGPAWPGDTGLDYLFNKKLVGGAPANASQEHFTVTGLKPNTNYTIQWLGSRTTGDASRNMYYLVRDNTGVITSAAYDVKGNTTNIMSINAVSNSSGVLYLSGYGSGSPVGATYAYYNALKIYEIVL